MTPREWYDEARRLRSLLERIEQMCYPSFTVGETVNAIESPRPDRRTHPTRSGLVRLEGESR